MTVYGTEQSLEIISKREIYQIVPSTKHYFKTQVVAKWFNLHFSKNF